MQETKNQASPSPSKSKEIPKNAESKLSDLASKAAEAEQQSGSEFMKPQDPSKKGRGRPRNEDRPPKPEGLSPDVAAQAYIPLATGLVESLSSFCEQIAEDSKARIIGQPREMMIQSGALSGYYFIGEGAEKWVALGTFLLIGTQAFANAYRLRLYNLEILKEERKRRDSANGAAGKTTPVKPDQEMRQ